MFSNSGKLTVHGPTTHEFSSMHGDLERGKGATPFFWILTWFLLLSVFRVNVCECVIGTELGCALAEIF